MQPASIVYAFGQSDSFGKLIVLTLLLLSAFVWTVIIEKSILLRKLRAWNRRFLSAFRDLQSPMILMAKHKGPIADIYHSGVDKLLTVLKIAKPRGSLPLRQQQMPRQLSEHEVEQIRNVMERSVSGQSTKLESRLSLLGTVVTISPFLGLLGTVWGVMSAFISMAQQGKPDIQAMAPGVSGALLTTVVGLIVAIPAVIGYNMLTHTVQLTITSMDDFVDDFIDLVETESASVPEPGYEVEYE